MSGSQVDAPLRLTHGTVFLSSKEFSDIAHTSEVISEYVDKCIEEVGSENFVQVVTDNASNNMGEAKLLKLKRPKIFWTSCATHTVNLTLEVHGVCLYPSQDIISDEAFYKEKRHCETRIWPTRKLNLRQMFTSEECDECKFSNTVKGKAAYATIVGPSFLSGVTLCMKSFAPLVKVLQAVHGFYIWGASKGKKDIIDALGNNKNAYESVIEINKAKIKDRLDTSLHLTAYLLNPFYLYNNEEVQNDFNASDAVIDVVGILHPEKYELQNPILMVELPMYKHKLVKFERIIAIKGCEVNDAKYDLANWLAIYGSSTPNLQRIATRILFLTTSSLGCERNWSTFKGVHTKKRNRKRKERQFEVLLVPDASKAQDWIVIVDEVELGLPWETVSEAKGAD
ncbi:hypothetical protein OSB04_003027 [Centaurea solstitialis]|uniref:HAT C-terminal dimerisation domain-containing protein n=1 Tax=Centaurea solstitialis TaxID=347529 RepID=A0AA38U6K9_9ASTR|nr:hypothetical protein OSB04_003027 [Centaurea solstitialis]